MKEQRIVVESIECKTEIEKDKQWRKKRKREGMKINIINDNVHRKIKENCHTFI